MELKKMLIPVRYLLLAATLLVLGQPSSGCGPAGRRTAQVVAGAVGDAATGIATQVGRQRSFIRSLRTRFRRPSAQTPSAAGSIRETVQMTDIVDNVDDVIVDNSNDILVQAARQLDDIPTSVRVADSLEDILEQTLPNRNRFHKNLPFHGRRDFLPDRFEIPPKRSMSVGALDQVLSDTKFSRMTHHIGSFPLYLQDVKPANLKRVMSTPNLVAENSMITSKPLLAVIPISESTEVLDMKMSNFAKLCVRFNNWHKNNPVKALLTDMVVGTGLSVGVHVIISTQLYKIRYPSLAETDQMWRKTYNFTQMSLREKILSRQTEIYQRTTAKFVVAYILTTIRDKLGLDLTHTTLSKVETIEELFKGIPFEKLGNLTVKNLMDKMPDYRTIALAAHKVATEAATDPRVVRSYRQLKEEPWLTDLLVFSLKNGTDIPDYKELFDHLKDTVPPLTDQFASTFAGFDRASQEGEVVDEEFVDDSDDGEHEDDDYIDSRPDLSEEQLEANFNKFLNDHSGGGND